VSNEADFTHIPSRRALSTGRIAQSGETFRQNLLSRFDSFAFPSGLKRDLRRRLRFSMLMSGGGAARPLTLHRRNHHLKMLYILNKPISVIM